MPFNKRKQKAVYWPWSGTDRFGNPTISATYVELDVRWEFGLAQEITPQSNPTKVDATVWVDRTIAVGSAMWKGAEDDLPSPVTDVYEVVEYLEVPSVYATKFERIVLLRSFGDSLPTTT